MLRIVDSYEFLHRTKTANDKDRSAKTEEYQMGYRKNRIVEKIFYFLITLYIRTLSRRCAAALRRTSKADEKRGHPEKSIRKNETVFLEIMVLRKEEELSLRATNADLNDGMAE